MRDAVILTGASGFIGSHLLSHLLNQNIPAFCFKTSNDSGEYRYNSETLKTFLSEVPKAYNYTIIHLAGMSSSQKAEENPNLTILSNYTFTKDILQHTNDLFVKRIIFASSSLLYEDSTRDNTEEANIAPKNLYLKTKLDSEKAILSDHRNGIVLRLTNVYGKNGKGVINKLIYEAKTTTYLQIPNANSARDFIYIDDVVDAMYKVFSDGLDKGIYNLSYGKDYSLLEIATIIQTHLPNIKINATNAINREHFRVNNTKIQHKLHWTPKVDLYNGIEKIIGSHS